MVRSLLSASYRGVPNTILELLVYSSPLKLTKSKSIPFIRQVAVSRCFD